MFNLLITKAFAQIPRLDTVRAATPPGRAATPPAMPLDTLTEIQTWLEKILEWGFTFFAVIAVGGLLYAAFLFLFHGGDEKKSAGAKNMLIYSVLAIILAALARTIPVLLRHILAI